MPLSVLDSEQGPALGSAIHAAVAAGAYPDIRAAAAAMGRRDRATPTCPIPANAAAYDALYAEYLELHDYFGRGGNDVMHRLRRIRDARARARTVGRATDVRDDRQPSPRSRPRRGRRPARRADPLRPGRLDRRATSRRGCRAQDLFVIKPSGVSLRRADAGLDGRVRPRRQRSSRATARRRRTPPRTPTSTGTCPRSAASCTPTRPTPRRGRRAASRSRACSR